MTVWCFFISEIDSNAVNRLIAPLPPILGTVPIATSYKTSYLWFYLQFLTQNVD